MNIFMRELRAMWKSLLFWVLGMIALIGVSMLEFEGLAASDGSLSRILEMYPQSLKALFGLGVYDINDPWGYLGVIYALVYLMAGLHAAMLGANLVAKEENDKTAEFLMVKPVNWDIILRYKLIAGAVAVAAINISAWFTTAATLAPHADSIAGKLLGIQLSLLFFQALFFILGACLAAVGVPKAGQYAVFAVFGMYLLKFVNDLSGVSFFGYLTPFGFLGAHHEIINGELPAPAFVAAATLCVCMFYIAMRRYPKRDMRV